MRTPNQKPKTLHGHRVGSRSSPSYYSWLAMWDRCRRSHHPTHKHYAGVEVCQRWSSFSNFLEDMGPRPDGKTLDRINNDLGYSPSNCKWSTPKEQARNKSNTRWITHNGQTKCLAAWSQELGISCTTIRDRLARGIPIDAPIKKPAL